MNKKILIIVVVIAALAGIYWLYSFQSGEQAVEKAVKNSPVRIGGEAENQLVDKNSLTLYVNTDDESPDGNIKKSCDAECEKTWLPFLFEESSAISQSSDPFLSKLNVFTRADGRTQYALGTKPLYRNINDKSPGDVNGDISGKWTVARP